MDTNKSANLREDQIKFLQQHPEVNFSAICRDALDQFRDCFNTEGTTELITAGGVEGVDRVKAVVDEEYIVEGKVDSKQATHVIIESSEDNG
jgi:hypothetical protein